MYEVTFTSNQEPHFRTKKSASILDLLICLVEASTLPTQMTGAASRKPILQYQQ